MCPSCGSGYPERSNYYDLVDVHSLGGEPEPSSNEQRLMESELVARAYERFWRPAFVRMVAGKGSASSTGGFPGEFFIHKNSLGMEDRDGPWLDLSCATGMFSRAMAGACPGDWVIGLDISRAMLDVASKRGKGYSNLLFVRADVHDIPLKDESISGVNNAGALHVYDDLEAGLAEIFRVLKPGGVYVGSTFSPATTKVRRVFAKAAGVRRFAPAVLGAWLSRIGFADYEEVSLGETFIFRARKP